MGQKVNFGFWLWLSGIMPCNRHLSLRWLKLAWWMQQCYSSQQEALHHAVITTLPMFALLTDQKKKGERSQPWTFYSCCKAFAVRFVFLLLQNIRFLMLRSLLADEETFELCSCLSLCQKTCLWKTLKCLIRNRTSTSSVSPIPEGYIHYWGWGGQG